MKRNVQNNNYPEQLFCGKEKAELAWKEKGWLINKGKTPMPSIPFLYPVSLSITCSLPLLYASPSISQSPSSSLMFSLNHHCLFLSLGLSLFVFPHFIIFPYLTSSLLYFMLPLPPLQSPSPSPVCTPLLHLFSRHSVTPSFFHLYFLSFHCFFP